jgi:hypothetical protein
MIFYLLFLRRDHGMKINLLQNEYVFIHILVLQTVFIEN